MGPNPPRPRTARNNVPITYTSGEQVEVFRFNWLVTLGVPGTALFLQVWLPRQFPFFAMFDLPLLVTIFFAISRRSPISGLLTGSAIGIIQDALTGLPIGVNGIAKTVVGYGASSLGVKLDVENMGSRFLVTLVFYVIHKIVYFTVARDMVALNLQWSWPHELGAALANALVGVFLFFALDRFKQRT
jgi:rod shape-determining protein MreD